MKKKSYGLIVLWMLICSVTSAGAQLSIGIGLPNVSIGINLPMYPELTPVPGYPVYYAPGVNANYFFYDGMYWVYQNDNWYASSWYNGPWGFVEPEVVPLFILRVPVSYYRQPPVYFRGWQSNAPPRWGQHWGNGWEQRHSDWNRWNRKAAPSRAPLPIYQRQYSGDRYPRQVEQQHTLRSQSYRYQPRDKVVRQHFKQQAGQKAPGPAQRGKQEVSPARNQRQMDPQRSAPQQQGAPAETRQQPQQRRGESAQKPAPNDTAPEHRGPALQEQRQQSGDAQREQQHAPKAQGHEQKSHDRGESQERQGRGQDKDEERGRGRNN